MTRTTNVKTPELTAEQRSAIERLLRFDKNEQTLGGYAGTGKTTVIRELKNRLPDFAVCAYTGKAANVLRRKGVDASTIHSLIYQPEQEEYTDDEGKKRVRLVFRSKPEGEFPYDGVIVDEASMVSRAIHDDLASLGIPIIFVGDHGQLEPVGDRSFNLMADPDITLETVHRNSGEIALFADFIRKGRDAADWERWRPDDLGEKLVRIVTVDDVTQSDIHEWDQIICAYNRTRVEVNREMRQLMGLGSDKPAVGDRVMCLQNKAILGLYNGQQGVVGGVSNQSPYHIRFDTDTNSVWIKTVPDQWHREKSADYDPRRGADQLPFDYCYCITCHKAQGDEWDNVLVLEQRCRAWEHSRWAYTAASRARLGIDWVCG